MGNYILKPRTDGDELTMTSDEHGRVTGGSVVLLGMVRPGTHVLDVPAIAPGWVIEALTL